MDHRDQEMVVQAAWMYYEYNLTHAQIAEKLNVSRPTVTRLIQTALDKGIVQIKVIRPLPERYRIQRELEAAFGLKDSVIFHTPEDNNMLLQEIAWSLVDYLRQHVKDGDTVGFGWATSFARVPDYLRWLDPLPNCRIVPMVGSYVGFERPFVVAAAIAEAIEGRFYPIFAPNMLKNKDALEVFMNEPSIQRAVEVAKQSDICFMNVGNTLDTNSLVKYSTLTSEDMREFRKLGLVGEAMLNFFDISGNYIPLELNDRVIGISWEELSSIPHIVVVSWGKHKVEALLGILRSGMCHTLISDVNTVRAVLEMNSKA